MAPSSKEQEAYRPTAGQQGLQDWQVAPVDDEIPPPPYGSIYGTIENEQDGLGTRASVTEDGRVSIHIDQNIRGLQSLLVPALRGQLNLAAAQQEPEIPEHLSGSDGRPPPRLNVVIHVVGSRGDVQPFVALGKFLKDKFQHRVRLATHPVFKDFVEENDLEFFSIGGDPSELMAFMVKNPGLMPGFDTLRRGDIGRRRNEIGNMIQGCWRSCIEPGDGSGVAASDNTAAEFSSAPSGADRPFVADAIIANPPSFAHIHCAEKLGIPIHMMFTMPWSPTQAFPHPLANIQSSNTDASIANFMSYALVDMMTWQGLGDVINRWRQKNLGLEPVELTWAPGMLARLKVPFTYCWSPTLIPKPRDWSSHISISGFYFLPLGSSFTPAADLKAFLEAGPPPVYIGFGSIVLDDPNAMTKLIFDAVKKCGQRALVSKGWGGFGADEIGIPEGVFMLGNVPHDWLFTKVSCVVHHGGAGTTAAGIACGKPTIIVPFFGDQPFWGAMVAKAGAGPKPIPHKQLTADNLAEAIEMALKPTTVARAKDMAKSINHEKGTEAGADSFHKQLDMDKLRCTLCPSHPAVWQVKRTQIRLSPLAMTVLLQEKLLTMDDVKLYRSCEYDTDDGPLEPISGAASALVGTLGSMAMGVADMPIGALKALNIHPDASRGKAKVKAAKGDDEQNTSRDRSGSESPTASRSRSPAATDELAATPETGNSQLQVPSSASRSRSGSGSKKYDVKSALGTTPKDTMAVPAASSNPLWDVQTALGTGKGALRIVGAGIKSPMDFQLGLARGFHNAPKLYGDETVRKTDKITGLASGLRVAGKEFGLGMFDGISGLVTQPLDGAKKEGAAGFFKGFAKGIGGVIFKPGAAVFGIPAYASQGFYKELQKFFGPGVENYIIAARTAQGLQDLSKSSEHEHGFIVEGWKQLQWYIKKNKVVGKDRIREIQAKINEKGSWAARDGPSDTDTHGNGARSLGTKNEIVMDPPARTSSNNHHNTAAASGDAELEEAIRRSIAETSEGNFEQDAELEQALRASMIDFKGVKGAKSNEYPQEKSRPAVQASPEIAQHSATNVDRESSPGLSHGQTDDDIATAMQHSREAHEKRKAEEDEEEVVMRYMMRQSLAEEELRKKRTGE